MDISMDMRPDSVIDTVENERFITRRTNMLKEVANDFMNKVEEWTGKQNNLTARLNTTVLDPASEESINDYMDLLYDLKTAISGVRSYMLSMNGMMDEIKRIMDNREALITSTVNNARRPDMECKYRLSNGRRCRHTIVEGTVYCYLHVDEWCQKCKTNHAIGEYHNGYMDMTMCKSCRNEWRNK